MHTSVPVPNSPCEILNIVPVNPLISKCMVKVCYVGEDPNRNKSVITKETARKMAASLPGSPIVGYYNENKGDFEGHEKHLEIVDGELKFINDTQPYGFIDLGAKVWFQKYLDDNSIEREYLCTEGYIWTGRYPETQRVIDRGNNQSMELDEKLFVGTWAKSDNQPNEFLIINEAVISGLCLLGEDVEPCFEGASVQKLQFSFEEDFKNQLFSMMKEMKEILDEGGHTMNIPTENEVVVVEETTFEEAPAVEEEVVAEEEAPAAEEVVEEEAPAEEEATEFEEKEDEEEKCEECGKPLDECTCDKEDKKEYDLSEIVEYTELNSKYEQLLTDYADLQSKIEALQSETEALREFKNAADRKEKEAMIENFYMLSDEDKKEVVEKINEYTVDEIEAKLSVICVRNKVNFSLDEENTANAQETVYNLDAAETQDDCVPAWIKSVRATAENL